MKHWKILLGLALASCGEPATDTKGASPVDDAGAKVDAELPTYVDPPFGTAVGDTIENLNFEGFAPEQFECVSNASYVRDLTQVRSLSFMDWRRGVTQCEKIRRQLLWIFITGGW
jgi:hypothetical protein